MLTKNKTVIENGELVITRIFNAPRELVWKAWSEPNRMMQWWGPTIFTTPHCEIDFRIGGKYLFCMRSPQGEDFWNTGIYKEIAPYSLLRFTNCFSDEKGNIVSATYYGMSAEFAMEMMTTVLLEEMDGKTKMTLHHTGLPQGTMTEQTGQGWNESFDKLEASLSREVSPKK